MPGVQVSEIAILKFLVISSLNLCFVNEVYLDEEHHRGNWNLGSQVVTPLPPPQCLGHSHPQTPTWAQRGSGLC